MLVVISIKQCVSRSSSLLLTAISLLILVPPAEWNGGEKEITGSGENFVFKYSINEEYDVIFNTRIGGLVTQKDVIGRFIKGDSTISAGPGVIFGHATSNQWNPDFIVFQEGTPYKIGVVCEDDRNGASNIYISKTNTSFVPAWSSGTNGNLVASSTTSTLIKPKVIEVKSNGEIRLAVLYGEQIGPQNIALKIAFVKMDGTVIGGISTINPSGPVSDWLISGAVVSGSSSTLFISWKEDGDIKLNVFNVSNMASTIATAQGYNNGITIFGVLNNSSVESDHSMYVDVGSGTKVYLTCKSNQDGDDDIYFNGFNVTQSTRIFSGYGINISNNSVADSNPVMTRLAVTDQFVIAWSGEAIAGGNKNIYAAKVNKISGAIEWQAAVCTAVGDQTNPTILYNNLATGQNVLYVMWEDARSGSGRKIYAQDVSVLDGSGKYSQSNGGGFQVGMSGDQTAPRMLSSSGGDNIWVCNKDNQGIVAGIATNDGTNVKPNKVSIGTNGAVVNSNNSVTINWSINLEGIVSTGGSGVTGAVGAGFKVERKLSTQTDNEYQQIADISYNQISFQDTLTIPDTVYNYRVRSYVEMNFSSWSGSRDAHSDYVALSNSVGIPAAPGDPPPTLIYLPTGLTATPVSSSEIMLGWTSVNSIFLTLFQISAIEIKRASGSDNNFALIATIPSSQSSYSDQGLQPATLYRYKIRYKKTAAPAAVSSYVGPVSATTFEGNGSEVENPSAPGDPEIGGPPVFIPDPLPGLPGNSGSNSASEGSDGSRNRVEGILCYVATSTYANMDSAPVKILKKMRREFVTGNLAGKYFVSGYSNLAPKITNADWFRSGCRLCGFIVLLAICRFVLMGRFFGRSI